MFADNERPFGHRTKGFFAFLDPVTGQRRMAYGLVMIRMMINFLTGTE
jgi:hypothetical protein